MGHGQHSLRSIRAMPQVTAYIFFGLMEALVLSFFLSVIQQLSKLGLCNKKVVKQKLQPKVLQQQSENIFLNSEQTQWCQAKKKKFSMGEKKQLVQSKCILNNGVKKDSLSPYLCLKDLPQRYQIYFMLVKLQQCKLINIHIYQGLPPCTSLILKNPSVRLTTPRHLCTHCEIILNQTKLAQSCDLLPSALTYESKQLELNSRTVSSNFLNGF